METEIWVVIMVTQQLQLLEKGSHCLENSNWDHWEGIPTERLVNLRLWCVNRTVDLLDELRRQPSIVSKEWQERLEQLAVDLGCDRASRKAILQQRIAYLEKQRFSLRMLFDFRARNALNLELRELKKILEFRI